MNNQSSIKKNIFFNTLKTIVSVVSPLITYAYITRVLGAPNLGKINFTIAVISYFQLCASLGINNYAISQGAKLRKDQDKFNKFCSEILFINLISTIIVYLAFIFLVEAVPFFKPYKSLLIIYSLSLIFTVFSMEWLFGAIEDFKYISIRSIIIQIIGIFLVFIFIKDDTDTNKYIFILLFPSALIGILNFFYSRKIISINFKNIEFQNIRKMLKPIILIWGMNLASIIYINSDTIMLTLMDGNEAVGLYSVATKTSHVVCLILNSISAVLLPRLSNYILQDDKKEFKILINRTILLLLLLTIPATVGLFMLSKESVLLLGGKGYTNATQATSIMALNVIFSPINSLIATQILIPLQRENKAFIATSLGGILNIMLNLYMIPKYSITGAAMTTIIAEFIVFIYCINDIKLFINFKKLLVSNFQYTIASIPVIIICFAIKTVFNNIIIVTLFSISISLIAYFVLLIKMNNESIQYLMMLLSTLIKDKLKSKEI